MEEIKIIICVVKENKPTFITAIFKCLGRNPLSKSREEIDRELERIEECKYDK